MTALGSDGEGAVRPVLCESDCEGLGCCGGLQYWGWHLGNGSTWGLQRSGRLFFLSGLKRLLWSEIQRFSASNMQLFFLSRSKRLLWSEIQRFFSFEHAALFFLSGSKALERSVAASSSSSRQSWEASGTVRL